MKTRLLSRAFSRVSHPSLTVGIRREDPTRIWERRTPLTPDAVHQLISERNVDVHIEHCDRRVFSDEDYTNAGASVQSTLQAAHIILGIKEPPLDTLIMTPPPPIPCSARDTRTYMMFSHTAKGQVYNTPLLSSFLGGDHPNRQKDVSDPHLPAMIDFELLTESARGKRTVGFGWFAGVAGVLESLSSMAHSHLEIGVASPFLYTPRPHTMRSLEDLRHALRGIGSRIANEGTPRKLGPFVIGLTGTGNVTQGCLSMLSELPLVKVSVKDLPALVANENTDLRKVYLVHAHPSDYFKHSNGKRYSRDDYYANPDSYTSIFCDNIAPYLTLFLNGAGWAPSYPRLMTNEQLTTALIRAQAIGGARFTNIGDISCDPEGGLQFLTHSTTLSSPFDKYRPGNLPAHLPSVQIMAVDILPSSIPLDASQHFSNALLPYLESVIDSYKTGTFSDALDRAMITTGGRLVEKYKWLQGNVDAWRAEQTKLLPNVLKKKRILILGSGMVAGPAVDKIAERADVELLIASNSRIEAERHGNVQHRLIEMNNMDVVSQLVSEVDVVISLLPVSFHSTVAELCIRHRKHLVTASYISDSMKALHDRAIEADVLLLNEIGLDPGIDHCSAISLISRLKAQNKKIVSFISFCGGLPSPEVDDKGPLGYKFSWSPRGVLTAALNSARYRLKHNTVNIPGSNLLKSAFPDVPISKTFKLEGLPNRDSFPYSPMYELGHPEGLRTLLRGTLRYPQFSEIMQFYKELGLLELEGSIGAAKSWSDLVVRAQDLRRILHPEEPVINRTDHKFFSAFTWLLDESSLPPLPAMPVAPLDAFATLLAHRLKYAPGEKDMVVLSHEIITQSIANPKAPEEVHTSSLITHGTDKYSAMARTVGLPVAFAALNVLDGKVPVRGVAGPGDSSIREPVLNGLEEVGLGMEESVSLGDSIETRLRPHK